MTTAADGSDRSVRLAAGPPSPAFDQARAFRQVDRPLDPERSEADREDGGEGDDQE